jgi:hypothetical protein
MVDLVEQIQPDIGVGPQIVETLLRSSSLSLGVSLQLPALRYLSRGSGFNLFKLAGMSSLHHDHLRLEPGDLIPLLLQLGEMLLFLLSQPLFKYRPRDTILVIVLEGFFVCCGKMTKLVCQK